MAEFWTLYLWPLIVIVAQSLLLLVILLVSIAYVLLADRKIWAAVQIRRGPNVVGPWGLLQSFADLLKFVFKEPTIPASANKGVFLLAPLVTCVLALAGWASNSKYPFLSALRSAAQMVSYEVSIGFVFVTVLLCVGSLNLSDVVTAQERVWFFIPLFPMFIIFFISALAETNRAPFDLPEGESELVAGFFVEYSSMSFALFFLGEYANMILMSALTTILFLGGWLPPMAIEPFIWIPWPIWFILKICLCLFTFIWVRATFPRYR